MRERATDNWSRCLARRCEQWRGELHDGSTLDRDLTAITALLRDPLRVAVIGRVSAGKLTLVNALLGREDVAKTGPCETTTTVTWYHFDRRRVTRTDLAEPGQGFDRPITRTDQPVPGPEQRTGARVDVYLDVPVLQRMTLIDTPGFSSATGVHSAKTTEFLTPHLASGQDEATAEARDAACALICLYDHVLRADEAELLTGFNDLSEGLRTTAYPAVAVLAKADKYQDRDSESPRDAMDVAEELCRRHRDEHRVNVSRIIPVSGLLATAARTATLTEADLEALRAAANDPRSQQDLDLGRFADGQPDLVAAARRRLQGRLGVYGLAKSMEHVRNAQPDLAGLRRFLADLSGIERLEQHLRDCLLDEADELKAATALDRLWRAAATAEREDGADAAAGRMIQHKVRTLQNRLAPVLDEIQVRHGLEHHPAMFGFGSKDCAAAHRLLSRGSPYERLGLPADSHPGALHRACQEALYHWRVVANDGTRRGAAAWAAFVVLRACETVRRLLDEDRPSHLEGHT